MPCCARNERQMHPSCRNQLDALGDPPPTDFRFDDTSLDDLQSIRFPRLPSIPKQCAPAFSLLLHKLSFDVSHNKHNEEMARKSSKVLLAATKMILVKPNRTGRRHHKKTVDMVRAK